MRILHAISGIDPRNGGPTNALIGLAAAQKRAGLDVRVISTWQERDAFRSAQTLENYGVGVRMVGPAHGKLSRYPALEKELIAEVSGADVVHIHAIWEEMQHRAARVAHKLERPYVMTPHGMLDPWNLTKSRWAKKLYMAVRTRPDVRQAAMLHFTSEIERDVVSRLGFDRPAVVEPLGVNAHEFSNPPPRGTFRARHPQQLGERPMILFLGRVHYGKGLEILVPALTQMKRTDAVLVIAGPDADGYSAKIRKLAPPQVLARMIFTGMVGGDDRLAVLCDADVLALPSYHENFGLAVIESLAVGTPVVISDQVYLHPEIARGGVGGVVPMDATALARELDRWLGDEALRWEASRRAPAFVRERYDWDTIARRWVGHYAKLRAS
jgi:glycosyltransferase involved in cell wall biosynthesis